MKKGKPKDLRNPLGVLMAANEYNALNIFN